jgi:hypothetical protein
LEGGKPELQEREGSSPEAVELENYITSDAQLYRSQYEPIIKNLAAKKARDIYDPAKAIKLFMYLVDAGAKKYNIEHGSQDVPWFDIFNKNTSQIANNTNVGLGNFNGGFAVTSTTAYNYSVFDVIKNFNHIRNIIKVLHENKIWTSLFVDPNSEQVTAARETNAYAIEINTGKYANAKNNYTTNEEYYNIKEIAAFADSLELVVNSGHGLTYHNVQAIANIPQMNELNIGFAIIAQSLFHGLPKAVSDMKKLIITNRQ